MTDYKHCARCGSDITKGGMDFGTVWRAWGQFDDVKGDYEESVTDHFCPGCYRAYKEVYKKFLDKEQEGE